MGQNENKEVGELALQVKAPVIQSEELSLVHRIHMREENRVLQVAFGSLHSLYVVHMSPPTN